MYWLLNDEDKATVRARMTALVEELSTITAPSQVDQLFPFVGRKDRRKAVAVVKNLTDLGDHVVDPFSGSGIFTYASLEAGRRVTANEWEPYTHRMSTAPWRQPRPTELADALEKFVLETNEAMNFLYATTCVCGEPHVLDSMFFDREPLEFVDVTRHERLGRGGETITYRGKRACGNCGAKEKHFSDSDRQHLESLDQLSLPQKYVDLFGEVLIPNSRINLSGEFTIYGNLFPQRSKLALATIWEAISSLDASDASRSFFEDVFLSILPQAKFKDYRSKSQDLHVPGKQLREVNIFYRFVEQFANRRDGLGRYGFAPNAKVPPIACEDFRVFLGRIPEGSTQLVLTDPPWSDGNAYFEKAQLYHPWMDYRLREDSRRMGSEMVVTDAPSRSTEHDLKRWWDDISELFTASARALGDLGYLSLFFRPIPASKWLDNLNTLKLLARQAGFEPLLAIDASSNDPSMRIQQSASFVFSTDVVFVFLKLPNAVRREFVRGVDLDHLAFASAAALQEGQRGPFTLAEWRSSMAASALAAGIPELNLPRFEPTLMRLHARYTDETAVAGLYLPKAETPFSGQLFDTPAIERLFTYVPLVVDELTRGGLTFSYDMFLLKLAEYVENGTRMLISDIQDVDFRALIKPYATPVEGGGREFARAAVPTLPEGIGKIVELDPYDFEAFTATLFERQGYTDVALIGRSGDRGVDVLATDANGRRVVIQCKRFVRANVSAEPIQRLHSFAVTRGADRGIVVTTSGFTPDAKDEARRTHTELIDGVLLEQLVARYMPDFIVPQTVIEYDGIPSNGSHLG